MRSAVEHAKAGVDAQNAKGVQVGDGNTQMNFPGSRQPLPVPRQLPPDVSQFTGRTIDLAKLDNLLDQTGPDQSTTMVISAVAGTAGVGKTALAIHWAHRMRSRFPDGDLYANLRGYDPGPPASPAQIIDGFLRAFDVPPDSIPRDVDAQTALFRSLLHGRRVLVVLDNARNPEQVRPLLPDSPESLVLITSRNNLSGLIVRDGASRIILDMLTRDEASDLVCKIIGYARAATDPDAIAAIARWCAYLPLALRIAAELGASRVNTSLAEIAAELGVVHERLDNLAVIDDESAAVRSVFSWSYRALPAEPARAFRLLGLHAGADFSVAAAAALIGSPPADTRRVLALLTNAHLLGQAASGRYRFHDLLRDYAAERATQDEIDDDRAAAIRRSLDWYLHTARAAEQILNRTRLTTIPVPAVTDEQTGSFSTHVEAFSWFTTELDNLVAATRQAAQIGEHTIATGLPWAAGGFFQLSMNFDAETTMATIGLNATQQAVDRLGEASMLGMLGVVANYRGRRDEAVEYVAQAVGIRRDLGQVRGMDLVNLGSAYTWFTERREEAVDLLNQGLALARERGEQDAAGHALECLAGVFLDQEDFDAAVDHAQQAIGVFRGVGLSYGEGIALGRLAEAYLGLGRFDDAIRYGQESLTIRVELGDRLGQAWSLRTIATALHDIGRREAADQHWQPCLDIFEALDLRDDAAWVRNQLSAPTTDS
jgi:tetratricopeptide (TPR) repeat protein